MNLFRSNPVRELPGGIHPPGHKACSLTRPIRPAPLPPQLIVPLTQPQLAEAEVLVQPGQAVLKGQVLARGSLPLGIAIHAPSSGQVAEIGYRPVAGPHGLEALCVILNTDGRDQWIEHAGEPDYTSVDRAALLQQVAEAGITGLGGAGFPTHAKLGSGTSGIHTLVINACECEPFITADDALMRERAPEIVTGIRILMHILQVRQCLLGIEDNKPEAKAALSEALAQEADAAPIDIRVVPSTYPSGAERQLIWLLTGMAIPTGQLPVSRGLLCQNVGTAYAVARAICHGEPLISRITTLTGAALRTPGNLQVLLGTPMDFLLQDCGLQPEHVSRLIMGGSLMGVELGQANLPVTRSSNCVIATTEQELPSPTPAQACIRCGLCAEACPVSLLPQQLYWFARGGEHDKAQQHNLFDCIECGACAYVCPSSIPLVRYYRTAKADIRSEQEKHARAQQAQARFEFHEQRKAREQVREEQRRRERAELSAPKTGSGDNARDAIQAALARVKQKKARQQNKEQP